MAKINLTGLVPNLQKVIDAVQALTPIAASLGGPVVANIATIGIAAIATIENILSRSGDLKEALSTQDEAKLRAMLSDLQAANDKLAGAISGS
jgi:hypothetical protein